MFINTPTRLSLQNNSLFHCYMMYTVCMYVEAKGEEESKRPSLVSVCDRIWWKLPTFTSGYVVALMMDHLCTSISPGFCCANNLSLYISSLHLGDLDNLSFLLPTP